MYTTPDKLLRFTLPALVQLCAAQVGARINDAALKVALQDGDISGYTAEEQADVTAAVDWVSDLIDDAARHIDTAIDGRYDLPLSANEIAASRLPEICENLVFWEMHTHSTGPRAEARQKETLEWLKAVRDGKQTIGGGAGSAPAQAADARISATIPSSIDWSGY